MREIHIHDTRSGRLVKLEPRDRGRVGIYACGPTVYGRIHIGNARPFVVFSLLKRFLEHEGYAVTLVINVTDVNDKIYDAARAAGLSSGELAAEMTRLYRSDTDALGLGRPDHEPLASQTMEAIIEYIGTLIESGHAYESAGDVYFRVRSDPVYGSLSHRRLEDMDQGEGDDADPGLASPDGRARKEDRLDFALWKAHKPDEDTAWDAPWGEGRPGWHIECSAMSEQLLGVGFDIHGGGSDLLFPHHENEAAQTRSARGQELTRIWMHNGMIQATGEKMAKSVGNIATLHELLQEENGFDRHGLIMYLIGGHYRQPLAFSRDELEDAARRVQRLRDVLGRLAAGQDSPPDMAHHRDAFFQALAGDFNTPAALAALGEWVREANRRSAEAPDASVGDRHLKDMLDVLGLGDLTPLRASAEQRAGDPEALALLDRREQARRRRDFETADRLREQLQERGWELRDGPDGPELIPAARP